MRPESSSIRISTCITIASIQLWRDGSGTAEIFGRIHLFPRPFDGELVHLPFPCGQTFISPCPWWQQEPGCRLSGNMHLEGLHEHLLWFSGFVSVVLPKSRQTKKRCLGPLNFQRTDNDRLLAYYHVAQGAGNHRLSIVVLCKDERSKDLNERWCSFSLWKEWSL
jgi:hypothetical protein